MAVYNFTSVWRLPAPIDEVWRQIYDWQSWPQWWRGVESAALIDPAGPAGQAPPADGVGAQGRVVWRSPMGYRLAVDMRGTVVDPPSEFAAIASGDLVGTATWRLSAGQGVTTVRFFFDVHTTRLWMRLLAPLVRPVFVWNHNELMRQGARGLAQRLGVPLLEDTEQ